MIVFCKEHSYINHPYIPPKYFAEQEYPSVPFPKLDFLIRFLLFSLLCRKSPETVHSS